MRDLNPNFINGDQSVGNIFSEMTRLALEHNAINLGQGMPDQDGPLKLRKIAAEEILKETGNQYVSPLGLPNLRQVIAKGNRDFYDLDSDPEKEILVTAGATEALNISLRVLMAPGEKIALFTPHYNFYNDLIATNGLQPVYIPLSPPEWDFNADFLERQIKQNDVKTILLNTPSNPTGKVFSRQEMEDIARIAKENDLFVISDEVYEFLTSPDHPHIPISSLDGMKERTIRISSAGKTFSFTGWRLGYLSAPKDLMQALVKAHTITTFCLSAAFQVTL